MSENKAVSPVVSESDLDKNVKDANSVAVVEPAAETTKTSLWRRIVGLVWDSVEGDPEYRKYVQRLDTFFLCVFRALVVPVPFPLPTHCKANKPLTCQSNCLFRLFHQIS